MSSRYCLQCGKALKACICHHIVDLCSQVELIILQHSSEQYCPMGTARILTGSLKNCHIFVGEDFSENDVLNQFLADNDYQHYVLYPNKVAHSVDDVFVQSHTGNKKLRIILLDGTWKKAFKIWQLSDNLHVFQTLCFPADIKGHYRIRKASNRHYLSTVEAGYHILSLFQPNQDFTSLLTTFNKMIDFQIQQMPSGVYERNYLKNE